MPALGVRAELRLVEPDKREVALQRHTLRGAQKPPRVLRHDALLAGDQRDALAPLHRHDAIVHLACEQPQREADHAARMRRHPLDREVRLAGVGGAEHRGDAGRIVGTHAAKKIGPRRA